MNSFEQEVNDRISDNWQNKELVDAARAFTNASTVPKYSYNFSWLGRPIIQYPQDMIAMQEIIWAVQPDLVIETGIAHGGSLIFSASMLELNAACGGPRTAEVLGVDIDIRAHNRVAIEAHPMFKRITMIEGSSIAPDIIEQVKARAADKQRVLVCLDSMHTHDHVLAELEAYAPLTSVNSYCVVFDTLIEDMPAELFPDRPWGPGNNPKTAVWEYLKRLDTESRQASDGDTLHFEIDRMIENKLLITVAPDGYLKRV
jgi:cephalosporin hydroxylase